MRDDPTRATGAKRAAPPVLIPATAGDVSRRNRRIVLSCCAAALLAGALGYWLYTRAMDPIHAQQSHESGVRLLSIARFPQAILNFDRAIRLNPILPMPTGCADART